MTFITFVTTYLSVPWDREYKKKSEVKMDTLGAVLIVCGLILVVFSVTDSSHAPDGWKTPYIYTLLIVGCLLLAIAVYVEGWVAEMPLLPFDLFSVKHMPALIISLLFCYGSLGVFLLYATF
jgi:hypothetical protein